MTQTTRDITIHLAEVGHLFNAPEFDPFAGDPQYQSGVERVYEALKSQNLRGPLRLTIILAGCLIVSALADGLTMLPDLLRRFLSEGFLIAGWVSIWHPVEVVLFEWWPNARDAQMYAHIRDAALEVRAGD